MRVEIIQLLNSLEANHGIRILYACESGSRAWGFPSPDSDFDVRFVYAHPAEWYFSVEEPKDTLEMPVSDVLDASGWELRKTLRQLRKSSATLLEWLQSPIVYQETGSFAGKLRELMPVYFSPRAVVHHHLGLVRKMWAESETAPDIRLKTAFYLLRSLLSAAWVREKGTVPPMTFAQLRGGITDAELASLVAQWLVQKAQSDEKARVPLPDQFRSFVQAEVARSEAYALTAPVSGASSAPLNTFLHQTILAPDDH